MTLETQSAFARRLGKHKAHVTRLKQAGRLVMVDDRVDVEATLHALEATASPLARDQAAAEYHAQQRATPPQPSDTLAELGLRHKRAVADKAEAEAKVKQLEAAQLERELVAIGEVQAAGIDAGVALRDGLAAMIDRHAAELAAAQAPSQVHALLSEAVEQLLIEFSRACERLASDTTR